MKRIIFILALSTLPYFVSAQDFIDDIFSKYSGKDNFTSIAIGKNLLDFAFSFENDANGELNKLKSKISDIKILISDNKNRTNNKFTDEIRSQVNKDSYLSLMEVLSGKKKVNIYVKKNNDRIIHVLLLASEEDQEVLLSLEGDFSMKELINIGKGSKEHGSFHHLSYLKSLEK